MLVMLVRERERESGAVLLARLESCLLSSSFQSAAPSPIAAAADPGLFPLSALLAPSPSLFLSIYHSLYCLCLYICSSGFPEMTQPCLYSTWLCHFASPNTAARVHPFTRPPFLSSSSFFPFFFFFFLVFSFLLSPFRFSAKSPPMGNPTPKR